MKKYMLVCITLLLIGAVPALSQLKYGGGLSIGTETGGINDEGKKKGIGFGVNGRVDYILNDKWSVAPNFTFWFPSAPSGINLTYWQLNGDVHYTFSGDESTWYYAIVGLNYSLLKAKYKMGVDTEQEENTALKFATEDGWDGLWEPEGIDPSYSDNKIGLNLGVGAQMHRFFGEIKYDTAFEQIAITIGVLF